MRSHACAATDPKDALIQKQVRDGWELRWTLRAVVGGIVGAEAINSTALDSHFGGSLEDHGPNAVL
ncbi:hypothetical protein SAMN05216482_6582 [Streptomyces sp. PAN_FS17]|nr:hypothetical protein SAMN05216482_6582 [Streptomyces sp. PAN_FS17]